MSNNDNIYNILNNFNKITKDAAAPTAATPVVKTKLQESMEQVVNEKYMGFKKTVAAVKKGGSAEDPEAVAAAIGRKKYGKEKFQKAAAAGKKLDEKAVNPYAVGMAVAKKKAGITAKPAHDLPKKVVKKAHEIAKKIDEKIEPPIKTNPAEKGKHSGKTIAELKKAMAAVKEKMAGFKERGVKVPEKVRGLFSELTFAIRAKQAHGGKWSEIKNEGLAEGDLRTDRMNAAQQDFYAKNPGHKRDDREIKSVGGRLATKVSPTGGVPVVTKKSITSFKEGDGSDTITPNWAKYVVKQIYNSDGEVTMTDLFDEGIPGLHKMFMDVAAELGLDADEDFMEVESEVLERLEDIVKGGHELDEGWEDMAKDVSRKAKEKGTGKFDKKEISTGTVYTRKYNPKSGETDDTENVSAEKRGRGRPKKSAFEDMSTIDKMISESFGELFEGAAWRPVGDPVSKAAPAAGAVGSGIKVSPMPSLGASAPAAATGSVQGGVWTATPPKAGQPGVAVPQGLDEVDAEMEDMRKMAGLKGGQKKLDRDHDGKLTGNDFAMLRKGLEEGGNEMEEHLDKVQWLMGPPNYFSRDGAEEAAYYSKDPDLWAGSEWEVELDEGDMEEGNAFSGAVAKAKADGIQPGETINVGGKEYDLKEGDDALNQMRRIAGLKECGMSPISGAAADMHDEQGSMNISTNQNSSGAKSVTITADGDAAGSLMQMLKLAGMGGGEQAAEPQGMVVIAQDSEEGQEQDYEEMDEEKDPRYQASTTPDEQVAPVQALTKGGNGDVAGQEKKMKPGGYQFGDNNLAMQESLSAQLMKEYNSIKIKK